MVQLAIASNPYFALSRVDLDRPGPHYSVDMVTRLRRELGPGDVYLIVGMDSLMDLPILARAERLMGLCYIVGVNRPGYTYDLAPWRRRCQGYQHTSGCSKRRSLRFLTRAAGSCAPRSADQYQVPEPVEDYIAQHHLYAVLSSGEAMVQWQPEGMK